MTLFGQIVQNVQHKVKNNLGTILLFNPKSKDVGNPEKIMHREQSHSWEQYIWTKYKSLEVLSYFEGLSTCYTYERRISV